MAPDPRRARTPHWVRDRYCARDEFASASASPIMWRDVSPQKCEPPQPSMVSHPDRTWRGTRRHARRVSRPNLQTPVSRVSLTYPYSSVHSFNRVDAAAQQALAPSLDVSCPRLVPFDGHVFRVRIASPCASWGPRPAGPTLLLLLLHERDILLVEADALVHA
jgi:hypothetical protein